MSLNCNDVPLHYSLARARARFTVDRRNYRLSLLLRLSKSITNVSFYDVE